VGVLGRDQQPADEVQRDEPAAGKQRRDHERDAYRGDAEAAPGGDAGREAARYAVFRVTPQRSAVTSVPPPPGMTGELVQVLQVTIGTMRAPATGPALPPPLVATGRR